MLTQGDRVGTLNLPGTAMKPYLRQEYIFIGDLFGF